MNFAERRTEIKMADALPSRLQMELSYTTNSAQGAVGCRTCYDSRRIQVNELETASQKER
jgi:hypothetical protein